MTLHLRGIVSGRMDNNILLDNRLLSEMSCAMLRSPVNDLVGKQQCHLSDNFLLGLLCGGEHVKILI